MRTWMVTGGSGFLGRHVLACLRDQRPAKVDRIVAIGRTHPGGWPVEDFLRADLDDAETWDAAVRKIRPDVVIHAAGKTPPAPSFCLYWANTRGTAVLLDSLKSLEKPCRVVMAGSAAELGPVPVESLPVNEDHPCQPRDAYGLSKWAATRLGLLQKPPLDVISGRIFNLIGPGMPSNQAFGRFAAMLAASGTDPMRLSVGDLSSRRDFVDVRDAASALIALAELGQASRVYHIGTGESRTMREGLDALIALSGRVVTIEESAPSRCGPSDSRADIGRIVDETGWRPRVSWEQSLADLWHDARKRSAVRLVA